MLWAARLARRRGEGGARTRARSALSARADAIRHTSWAQPQGLAMPASPARLDPTTGVGMCTADANHCAL
eukprot:15352632-Alexandrium_andersonii.AAC.1